MTKDEALDLALEALEQMQAKANFECWNLDICDEAITAIKQARAAQQEHEEDLYDLAVKADNWGQP